MFQLNGFSLHQGKNEEDYTTEDIPSYIVGGQRSVRADTPPSI